MSQISNVGRTPASNQIEMPTALNVRDITRQNVVENGDAADDATTRYRIGAGDVFSGNLDTPGDRDWVAINLSGGGYYQFDLRGEGNLSESLGDPYLYLYDSNGILITTDDDGGNGRDAALTFTPDVTGTYYLSAASFADSDSGAYRLSASVVPAASLNELANYLTTGFWVDQGETPRAFDTSDSNRITADISGLTAAGKQLARWAMEAWEMVADIDFRIVNTPNARIVFDDWDDAAYSTSTVRGNTIVESFINISPDWLRVYGTTLDSYAFQTYIHELGHALGLGHQGDYNGFATYGVDETFVNDSYQLSVMSYFNQTDNTTVNADFAWLLTTMMVDNIAIQNLYGRASGPTAGNTVWGAGTNLSGYMSHFADYLAGGNGNGHFAGVNPVALTIYDSGGHDTLNLSFSTGNDRISLRQTAFSNIDGLTGNLGIAKNTAIENLIAGSGDDFILGNAVANAIRAGAGNDTVRGGNGSDRVAGGAGNDRLIGEAGNDRLSGQSGNDHLIAGAGRDLLDGNGGADKLFGGAGNDRLSGGAAHDRLSGDSGHDRLNGGSGNDTLLGGTGNDLLRGQTGNDFLVGQAGQDKLFGGERADTLRGGIGEDELNGDAGSDFLFGDADDDEISTGSGNNRAFGGSGDDDIVGGAGSDRLSGGSGADFLSGRGGNDRLIGGIGNDRIFDGGGHDLIFGGGGADNLIGGAGRDTFTGGGGADTFRFSTGDGRDIVTDFSRNDAEDIDLSDIREINNFADLVNNHLRNANGDAMIVYNTGSIRLAGVDFGEVGVGRAYDADDFIF